MTTASRAAAVATHPIALWGGFVLVHLWLGLLALFAPGYPLGDVTGVYRFWVEYGLQSGEWVGLTTSGVYPLGALAPMLGAAAFGSALYASTWLSLVMLIDAGAFLAILAAGRAASAAAWWWLGLLVLLGPVALGRIDAVCVALALAGMLALLRYPAVAGALLAAATWVKVWPAALAAAAVLALRTRWWIVAGGLAATLVVLATAFALGGDLASLFSFVAQQTSRGLQIEAVIATPWMWQARLSPADASVYYDQAMLTYQLTGAGAARAAAIATPLLVIVTAALLAAAAIGVRRGVPASRLLPPLALALTVALIVCNKVGSPQFVTWLAVPIVFGLVVAARGEGGSFRVPAVLGLVIAALTQVIYPYWYSHLLGLEVGMLIVFTARNALDVVLLGWAVWQLARVVMRPAFADHAGQVDVRRIR